MLQRLDARLQDRIGCGEIRLADPQRDHILHRSDNIEEFANARWLKRGYPVGEIAFGHDFSLIGLEPFSAVGARGAPLLVYFWTMLQASFWIS
ncbi:MAG: hypothetical protein A2W35_03080 [Chloroflexi bacterium RBG_16_57_11]|nr:MAG: hypothetical protein A2W35_03080 [Chloroflexi bacterium RBG_16_57_11]